MLIILPTQSCSGIPSRTFQITLSSRMSSHQVMFKRQFLFRIFSCIKLPYFCEQLDVTMDGLLNGVDVNTSLMRIDQGNVITGKKSVKTLLVQGSIDVCNNCSVGTFDISNWASRAVLRKGNFTLSGAKFESLLFQQPLNLNGTLNNVAVSRDLVLTLSDQQEIHGRLSLSSLLPETMLYTSEQVPFYQKSTEGFKVAGQFTNLQIHGLYDGISLPHFYDQLVNFNVNAIISKQ